ncbi:hypothetical protein [Aquimarina sp. 2201CG5-10]|uniref:hypothetical protein n=1 Tax=Aquimarina callyspongiae TaxID=3098150 RepID=UPI002AB55637|nr:hypothetical protein [Aquimarina sp. 2201CG5-10]MDY8138852.1 hypothetical protein [Aquimarina sp. 2201CG5-10]
MYLDNELYINESLERNTFGHFFTPKSKFGIREIIIEKGELKKKIKIYNFLVTWIWIDINEEKQEIDISYSYFTPTLI